MARKLDGQNLKSKEDRSNRKSTAVSMAKDLAHWIGVIAQHRQVSQAELLDPVIRDWVEAQYAIVSKEIAANVAKNEAIRKTPKHSRA